MEICRGEFFVPAVTGRARRIGRRRGPQEHDSAMIEPEGSLSLSQTLAKLPPQWHQDLLGAIQRKVRASQRKIVVLDDDPTGTQTVHDIAVLTSWSVAKLEAELKKGEPVFYILTNSRSLVEADAVALNRQIGANLQQAADRANVEIEWISRSDSTLRGHFPAEIRAMVASMRSTDMSCLIIPFFLEGGRLTIDNIHFVAQGDRLVPAARTPFAQDAAFGYRNSDLRRWVEEKTGGQVPYNQVAAVSLDDIRRGGPKSVRERLAALAPGSFCVVNAVSYRDLEVFVSGLLEAQDRGHRFVYRSAASFVRVRAGIAPRGLLARDELEMAGDHGALYVVGSHVPQTTAQLETLLEKTSVDHLEVNVAELLDDTRRQHAIGHISLQANRLLRSGRDTVLFTSRAFVRSDSGRDSLDIGRRVSDSLVAIIRRITCRPRYLVAKGGITSSDVATRGLNVRRARVSGQILPGVPVWELDPESRYPGLAYIVFPGNVGAQDALAQIHEMLKAQTNTK
jgi:uncharacterized protein YgbK (DUF1537 family)